MSAYRYESGVSFEEYVSYEDVDSDGDSNPFPGDITPPWQNSLKKDQITNTDLQSGTTRPKPTQSLL